MFFPSFFDLIFKSLSLTFTLFIFPIPSLSSSVLYLCHSPFFVFFFSCPYLFKLQRRLLHSYLGWSSDPFVPGVPPAWDLSSLVQSALSGLLKFFLGGLVFLGCILLASKIGYATVRTLIFPWLFSCSFSLGKQNPYVTMHI